MTDLQNNNNEQKEVHLCVDEYQIVARKRQFAIAFSKVIVQRNAAHRLVCKQTNHMFEKRFIIILLITTSTLTFAHRRYMHDVARYADA